MVNLTRFEKSVTGKESTSAQSQNIQESENFAMSEKKAVESKEWALEPETEYRFELDPGSTLAIKVCPPIFIVRSDKFLRINVVFLAHKGSCRNFRI